MGICVSCRRRDLQAPDKRAGGAGGARVPAKGAAAELLPRRVDPAMANSISNIKMTNPIKGIVSKRRKRYIKDGFNLDLAYITDRLIAMGFPAEKLEGVYRNHIDEVYRFLEQMHKDHYKIYNLCSERFYDTSKFHGRVERYAFEDHAPPKLELIQPFCEDVHSWLTADPRNVAAVHCKAGKGRTGTMVCCYLLYSGQKTTADEALKFYGTKRTHDEKGVTIPSQRRYVEYYAALVGNRLHYTATKLHIRELVMSPPPALNGGQCTLELTVMQATPPLKAPSGCHEVRKHDNHIRMVLDQCTPLHGDVRVDVYNKPKMMMRKEKLFHFWFNTFFVANSVGAVRVQPPPDSNLETFKLTLNKWQLDDAHKDKLHKIYSSDFKVEVVLQQQPESSRFSACGRAPSPPSSSASDTTDPDPDPDPDSEHWDSGEHVHPHPYMRLHSDNHCLPPAAARQHCSTSRQDYTTSRQDFTTGRQDYTDRQDSTPGLPRMTGSAGESVFQGYMRLDSAPDNLQPGTTRSDSISSHERAYTRQNSNPGFAGRPTHTTKMTGSEGVGEYVFQDYMRLESSSDCLQSSEGAYTRKDNASAATSQPNSPPRRLASPRCMQVDEFCHRMLIPSPLDTLAELCPHGCIDEDDTNVTRKNSRPDELCPHGYRIVGKSPTNVDPHRRMRLDEIRSDCTERLEVELLSPENTSKDGRSISYAIISDNSDVEMTTSCNNCIQMDFSQNCMHKSKNKKHEHADSCKAKSQQTSPLKTMEHTGILTKDGYMLIDRTPRFQKDALTRLSDPIHTKKQSEIEKCSRLSDPTSSRKCRHAGMVSKDGYMLVDATPRQPQIKDGRKTPTSTEVLGLPAVTNMRLNSETLEENYMEFTAKDGYMKAVDPKITNYSDEYAFMCPDMSDEKAGLCHAANCKIIAGISDADQGTSGACFSDAAQSATETKSGKNKKHSFFKKDDYKNDKGKIPKVSSDHTISDDSKKKLYFFQRRDDEGSKPKFVFGDVRASWREFSGKWSDNRKKKDRDDS